MISELLRKVSVLSVASFMATGVAFANSAENVQTGADSDNDNDVDIDQDIDEDVDNHAAIDNEASAESSSGGNEANENTGGGEVDSGDADIEAELENVVNTLEAYFSGNFGDVDWDLLNKITGSNSDNSNDLDVDQDIDLDIENNAWLRNCLRLLASTGENEANKNTGGGDVDTGDATAMAEVMNELNLAGELDVKFGDVDVSATNEKTGADSDNDNDIDVDQDVDIDIANNAEVRNAVMTSASTGGNEANKNTGGGEVKTGKAESSAKITNSINQGSGYGGIEFPDVDVDVKNDTTGYDSDNDNDVDIDQDVDIDVDNHAEVSNEVHADSSTGGNEANKNTGGGSVDTGDATVKIEISNTVN